MATILLTWELGAGLGHLLPLRAIGQALVARGHSVIAALPAVDVAIDWFASSRIALVQAPKPYTPSQRFPKIGGFAQMLANVGFADSNWLSSQFKAWNTLLDTVQPQVIVSDHSPTVLLALRGRKERVINLGLAFYSPPDVFPLPFWTPTGHLPAHLEMAQEERPLTQTVNALLEKNHRPPLERLGQLFNQVDDLILATYKELDPFGPRQGVRYWGHWHGSSGSMPRWPDVPGPKLFAYLKPFPGLDPLLASIKQFGLSALIVAGELAPSLQQKYGGVTMHFERNPVDMLHAASTCDLGITNGGHGVTASLLLAGKPSLLFPIYVEQLLTAQAVARLSAGNFLLPHQYGESQKALQGFLARDAYHQGAKAFAIRYGGQSPGQQVPELIDRIERHAQT